MAIVGIHPGSFRPAEPSGMQNSHKSGKQRTYGIRNLEEHTEDGMFGRAGEILRLAMLAQDDYLRYRESIGLHRSPKTGPHRIVDLEECTENGRWSSRGDAETRSAEGGEEWREVNSRIEGPPTPVFFCKC